MLKRLLIITGLAVLFGLILAVAIEGLNALTGWDIRTGPIVGPAIGLAAAMMLAFGGFSRKTREQAIAAAGGEERVEQSANCFGVSSKGAAQWRGNGCLALGPERLAFVMWTPRRELVIDLARITSVEEVDAHLGKSIRRPLLKVTFTTPDDVEDSVAWWVRDVAAWRDALRS